MLPLHRSSVENAPARRKSLRLFVFGFFAASMAVGVACSSSSSNGSPASGDDASASSSGSSSGGSSGGSSGSSSGGSSGSSSGSSSGTTAVLCPAPAANTSTLPFAVDSTKAFVASGYEGDYSLIQMPADTTCGGNRSGATALGACHTVNYTIMPYPGSSEAGVSEAGVSEAGVPEGGPAAPTGPGTGRGWAGVVWQFPANNWGTSPGYLIPAGATTVSFYARGKTGTEVVSFSVGGIGYGGIPSTTAPCEDTINASLPKSTLATGWTHYTIPIANMTYAGGVLNGFSWTAGAADQPSGTAQVTFYIDDIEWQM